MGYHNNQTNEDHVHPFERYQYDWALAEDPSYRSRVYYLVCLADFSSAPEDGSASYHEYEHSSLFIPTPRGLEVEYVPFLFNTTDDEEQSEVWDPSIDPDLDAYVDEIMEDYFGGDSDDEVAAARQNIRQVRSILHITQCLLNSLRITS